MSTAWIYYHFSFFLEVLGQDQIKCSSNHRVMSCDVRFAPFPGPDPIFTSFHSLYRAI